MTDGLEFLVQSENLNESLQHSNFAFARYFFDGNFERDQENQRSAKESESAG